MFVAVESGPRERDRRREEEAKKFAAARARYETQAARLKQQLEQIAPGAADSPQIHAALELCAFQPDATSAVQFVFEKLGTRRRGEGAEPCVLHALRVTGLVASRFNAADRRAVLPALLHDVLEDSDTTADEIAERFGRNVAGSVEVLTKPKHHPQAERVRLHQQKLKDAPEEVVLVKLADLYDNLQSRRGSRRVKKTFRSANAFLSLLAERPAAQRRTREAMRMLETLLAEIATEQVDAPEAAELACADEDAW